MAAAASPPRVVLGVSASLAAEAHDVETWLRGNNSPSTIWDTLAAAQLADDGLPYASSPSKSGLEVAAEEKETGNGNVEKRVAPLFWPGRLHSPLQVLSACDPYVVLQSLCMCDDPVHPVERSLVGAHRVQCLAETLSDSEERMADRLMHLALNFAYYELKLFLCMPEIQFVADLMFNGVVENKLKKELDAIEGQEEDSSLPVRRISSSRISRRRLSEVSVSGLVNARKSHGLEYIHRILGLEDGDEIDAWLAKKSWSARLAFTMRRAREVHTPHVARHALWIILYIAGLPILCCLPAQLLDEELFNMLASPQERYWILQTSHFGFVILLLYFGHCAWGPAEQHVACGAQTKMDVLLGLWLLGMVIAEAQHAYGVALYGYSQGRRFVTELFRLHLRTSGWKRLDLVSSVFLITVAALRLYAHTTKDLWPTSEISLRAVSTTLMWARVFNIFSLRKDMGPLMVSIQRMFTRDLSRYFLLQILIVMVFGSGLSVLFRDDPTLAGHAFGTPGAAVVTLLEEIFSFGGGHNGDVSVILYESNHVYLGWTFLACFSVCSLILVSDLLIGMLATTFTECITIGYIDHTYKRTLGVMDMHALPFVPPPFNTVQLVLYSILSFLTCRSSTRRADAVADAAAMTAKTQEAVRASWTSASRESRQALFHRMWDDLQWWRDPTETTQSWQKSVSRITTLSFTTLQEQAESTMSRQHMQDRLLRDLAVKVDRISAALRVDGKSAVANHAGVADGRQRVVDAQYCSTEALAAVPVSFRAK